MSQFTYKEAYGRNLPHIQPPAATLFVTFRLAGSIPRTAMEEWLREKRQLAAAEARRAALGQPAETRDQITFQRRWFRKFESLLHSTRAGPLWLGEPRIAELVREALHYRDGKVYRLDAFCIMPNHVHVVFAPMLSERQAREMALNAWREKRASFESGQARSLVAHEGNQADGDSETQPDVLDGRGRNDVDGEQPTQPNRLRYQAVALRSALSISLP